jgi:hypothetical protein
MDPGISAAQRTMIIIGPMMTVALAAGLFAGVFAFRFVWTRRFWERGAKASPQGTSPR